MKGLKLGFLKGFLSVFLAFIFWGVGGCGVKGAPTPYVTVDEPVLTDKKGPALDKKAGSERPAKVGSPTEKPKIK